MPLRRFLAIPVSNKRHCVKKAYAPHHRFEIKNAQNLKQTKKYEKQKKRTGPKKIGNLREETIFIRDMTQNPQK
jgi:hypothetical protein